MKKNELMRTMSLQEQQEINGGEALDVLINTIVDILNGRIPIYV
ncbi:hypothetical protein [Phocaeicola faecicola]|jgi:hypothetical protein|nr:hypothetical protein [Phocaeicola faecicola]